MEYYDVIVVGGGPIGCRVAKNLGRAGIKTIVLEAKSRIGYPNHCSGLVPPEFIDIGQVPHAMVLNHIKGAQVYSYKEDSFHFKRETPYAVVIDRTKFDIFMEESARREHVQFLYNAYVSSIKLGEVSSLTLTSGKEFKAKVIVLATGAANAVQKMLHIEDRTTTIFTAQVDVDLPLNDPEIAYIYMNNSIAHNWFSWAIPTDGGCARVGFGSVYGKNILNSLDMLFSNWSILKNAKRRRPPVVWSIPTGIREKTVFETLLLVGDAANQIKPFSGGGLLTGFLSADVLTTCIIDALKQSSYKTFLQTLAKYEKAWRRLLQGEFKKEILLRDVFTTLTDEDKALVIQKIERGKAQHIIGEYGFMDKPSIAGLKLLFSFKEIPLLYIKRKVFLKDKRRSNEDNF